MGILGERRGSWSPPSCNFQLGFHLAARWKATSILTVPTLSAQGGDATGGPGLLHVGHTDKEVAPARAWARKVDALLFSSALSPARIREM